jgi:hypothetical protein
MFTLFDHNIKLPTGAQIDQIPACPIEVYNAWIARVKANKTPVKAGDTYVWLYAQVVPPKLVNCMIVVKPGDDYPPLLTGDPVTG